VGVLLQKKKIRPSGVIATIVHHRQNAASGRLERSPDGAIIEYSDRYCIVNSKDSITIRY